MANMDRYIKRNDVYALFDKSGMANLHVADIDVIQDADVIPVVRCRECKLHTSSAFYPDKLFCQEHGRYVDPDGYCYLGERKEGVG